MATRPKRSSKKRGPHPQADVAKLQRRATSMPGIVELVQLYEQHARTVRQADAYQVRAATRIIIASGAASA